MKDAHISKQIILPSPGSVKGQIEDIFKGEPDNSYIEDRDLRVGDVGLGDMLGTSGVMSRSVAF